MSNRQKPRNRKQRPTPVNFDAIRAKRQRVLKEVPPITIGGKNYAIAPTIPLAVTDYFAENAERKEDGNVAVLVADMQKLLKIIFGADQWAEISELIDIADVPPLFQTVFDTYQESVGESSNSGQS